ncbi:hypothetical protein [Advenella mimigardefordensis]|uniref:hypothetical protein n=1 Tax=Advenella mimigardefordensis TaxID=302406 RepID=UPI0009FDBE98|nr:hypothetical protein [Advenella mimigardefordensis]
MLIPATAIAVVVFVLLRDRKHQSKRKGRGSSDGGYFIAGADSASVSHAGGSNCSISDSGGDCGGGDSGGGDSGGGDSGGGGSD